MKTSKFSDCSKCPLVDQERCIGETNSKEDLTQIEVLILAEAPSHDEIRLKRPLIGRAGQVFREAFQLTKLDQFKHDYFVRDVPVVGVYYQKPIMPEVQQSWDPSMLCDRVKQEIKEMGDCKICLFADQAGFLDVFAKQFGKQFMHISCLKNNQ